MRTKPSDLELRLYSVVKHYCRKHSVTLGEALEALDNVRLVVFWNVSRKQGESLRQPIERPL